MTFRGSATSEDDSEYQQLIDEVSANVKELASLFTKISNATDGLGKQNDSTKLRSELQQNIDAANRISKETTQALKRLGGLAANMKEKKQKVDKISLHFNTKVNDRLKVAIKTANEKLQTPLRNGGGPAPSPSLMKDNTQRYSRSRDNGDEEQQAGLLAENQDDTQIKLDEELEVEDEIIQNRARHIKEIQGQVVQVNEIFRDIARLVEDQGEMIDNIQTNIVTASDHVESGLKEVKEADKSQQSSRKKLCFLAIFVTVIVAIVIIVVVVLAKKG